MTNNAQSRIAAVLLDLDGTLVDTAPDLAGAINRLRAEEGLEPVPPHTLRPYASFGARGLLGAGFGIQPDDEHYPRLRDRFIELYRDHLHEASRPFDGMREALTALSDAGLGWGVVTNKFESLAAPLVEAMAFIPPPACVVGGDTAGKAKPDPAPLLLAAERVGHRPETCVYVGDSERDIAAGRAAGMITVAAAYGYIDADEDAAGWRADFIIETAGELTDVLAALHPDRAADGLG